MTKNFIERILIEAEKIIKRYEELDWLIAAPEIIADNKYWRKLVLEKESLEDTYKSSEAIIKYDIELQKCLTDYDATTDEELKLMLISEIKILEEKEYDSALKIAAMLNPLGYEATDGAIIEIRCIEGENSIQFTAALTAMYQKFLDSRGIRYEISGGITEKTAKQRPNAQISAAGGYRLLKAESGIHRGVGIDGITGKKASITDTIVAVIPAFVTPDPEISDKDIRIDVYHSSGAGGQNVNKVETAIRITHFPTGITVTCQDERSQLQNRLRAMNTLRDKITSYYEEKKQAFYSSERKKLSKDKAAKVRIYDYAENIAEDCRTGVTADLNEVLLGRLEFFI